MLQVTTVTFSNFRNRMPPKPFQFLHFPRRTQPRCQTNPKSFSPCGNSREFNFLNARTPRKQILQFLALSLSLSKTQERKKERKAKPGPSMADKKESKPYGEEETKIPVFTVLKNGAILKNIFIVNNHPCPPPPPSPPSISQNPDQAHEEILTVGRHPDCNITLTHPSISRFHLQIHSNPSKQHLSVVDLSSGESFFLIFNLFLWFEILGFSSSSFNKNHQNHVGFLVLYSARDLGFGEEGRARDARGAEGGR